MADISGQRFGMLLAIRRGTNSRSGQPQWHCLCDCGNDPIAAKADLIRGHSTSCGCRRKKTLAQLMTTHGYRTAENREKYSREYATWANMIQRCTNPATDSYKDYGGRGITVCERWRSFDNFMEDMGPKPSPKYSIERDDVNKGYEPGNCFWLPKNRQAENRRNCIYIELSGQKVTLKEASRRLGQNYGSVRSRIRRGKTPRSALGLPA